MMSRASSRRTFVVDKIFISSPFFLASWIGWIRPPAGGALNRSTDPSTRPYARVNPPAYGTAAGRARSRRPLEREQPLEHRVLVGRLSHGGMRRRSDSRFSKCLSFSCCLAGAAARAPIAMFGRPDIHARLAAWLRHLPGGGHELAARSGNGRETMLTLGLSGFMFPAGSAACRIKENTPPPHAFLSGQASLH
jgi:hypothetical protein